jgi:hypothetical protein
VPSVQFVPGSSARFWWILARISVAIFIVAAVIIASLEIFGSGSKLTVFIIGAPVVALSMIANVKAFSVEKRETSAGYTTVPWTRNTDVAQVDSQSGRVLRAAGQPLLTRQEYAIALANSRALTG